MVIIPSDLRDYQLHCEEKPWSFCPCSKIMDLTCIANRICISHHLLMWEFTVRANSVLTEEDRYIYFSEFNLDRRVLAFIRLYLFDVHSETDLSEEEAIEITSCTPSKVYLNCLRT